MCYVVWVGYSVEERTNQWMRSSSVIDTQSHYHHIAIYNCIGSCIQLSNSMDNLYELVMTIVYDIILGRSRCERDAHRSVSRQGSDVTALRPGAPCCTARGPTLTLIIWCTMGMSSRVASRTVTSTSPAAATCSLDAMPSGARWHRHVHWYTI